MYWGEKVRDTKISIFYTYMAYCLCSSYTVQAIVCLAIQCSNAKNALSAINIYFKKPTYIKHVLLYFTGNISGDIIDELMSSDGKYLPSFLIISSSSMVFMWTALGRHLLNLMPRVSMKLLLSHVASCHSCLCSPFYSLQVFNSQNMKTLIQQALTCMNNPPLLNLGTKKEQADD